MVVIDRRLPYLHIRALCREAFREWNRLASCWGRTSVLSGVHISFSRLIRTLGIGCRCTQEYARCAGIQYRSVSHPGVRSI